MHLARSARARCSVAGTAAVASLDSTIRTAVWLVRESFAGKEFLFARTKRKCVVTIGAGQRFIRVQSRGLLTGWTSSDVPYSTAR